VWQLEHGEGDNNQDTPHYQGFIHLAKNARLAAVRALNGRAHWEKCKGTAAQNKAYCTKAVTRVDGPWEIGTMPLTPAQTEKARWTGILADARAGNLAALEEREPKVYALHESKLLSLRRLDTSSLPYIDARWYWGDSGAGKSRTARTEFPGTYTTHYFFVNASEQSCRRVHQDAIQQVVGSLSWRGCSHHR